MAAPTARHWGIDNKYVLGGTKVKKIRGRENISIRTLHVRTLRPDGTLEELNLEMDRYHWNTLGRCEKLWKNSEEMSSDGKHNVYFSGEEDRHEYVVGFLLHKGMVSAVLGCRPVSSRLISIRLRASPFNVTIMHVYLPTSGHDHNEADNF